MGPSNKTPPTDQKPDNNREESDPSNQAREYAERVDEGITGVMDQVDEDE